MENLNINTLLNRNEEANKIKYILKDFELNKNNLSTKRGLYIQLCSFYVDFYLNLVLVKNRLLFFGI